MNRRYAQFLFSFKGSILILADRNGDPLVTCSLAAHAFIYGSGLWAAAMEGVKEEDSVSLPPQPHVQEESSFERETDSEVSKSTLQ